MKHTEHQLHHCWCCSCCPSLKQFCSQQHLYATASVLQGGHCLSVEEAAALATQPSHTAALDAVAGKLWGSAVFAAQSLQSADGARGSGNVTWDTGCWCMSEYAAAAAAAAAASRRYRMRQLCFRKNKWEMLRREELCAAHFLMLLLLLLLLLMLLLLMLLLSTLSLPLVL